jgi:thiol-disulfide isomerase/thioredoxin
LSKRRRRRPATQTPRGATQAAALASAGQSAATSGTAGRPPAASPTRSTRAEARADARAKSRAARRSRSSSKGRDRSLLFLGGGAIAIVGAAIAALLLTQGGSTPIASPSAPAASPATVTGDALPLFVATADDPAVGTPSPGFQASSFDGEPVSVSADGRAKLLLFLAHWCPHCQAEVPVVQDWVDAGRLPADVDLVSVATSIDASLPNYPPDAWLEREGWTPPTAVDPDNAIANQFGLPSFPYWVTVNADGSVAQRLTGELSPEQLDQLVAPLSAS